MNKKISLLFVLMILTQANVLPFSFVHKDCPYKEIFQSPKAFFANLKQACNLYFKSANDEQWDSRSLGDAQRAKQYLGYDLKLEYIYEHSATQNKTTTLYLHGWGDTKNSARIMKKFCKVIDDNVVTFNFPDARPIIGKLKKSSFGQLSDILTAIYAAHCAIQELNLESLNLFGISRGGGTIINMLALLNNDELFSKHSKELTKIGIDQQARRRILNAIQKGTIILDIPLRSMSHTPLPKYLVQKLTCHNYDEWEPLNNAKLLTGLTLNILVHFQHADFIVSNTDEAEFFYDLAWHNPASTYLVMGDDGGHLHNHAALSKTVCDFKALHNFSYIDMNKVQIIEPSFQNCKSGVLIQFATPSLETIKKLLEQYHNEQTSFLRKQFQKLKALFSKK